MVFRDAAPGPKVSRGFRYAQTVSAAAMAFGHGMQDAAKTAGVVVLTLRGGGLPQPGDQSIPLWVLVLSAVVISLGTYAGGWRIMRTLGRRIIHLDPPQGFAAETTAAAMLYAGHRHRCPDLDDARHHLGDHGRRRDEAAEGRALGRGRSHRRRVGVDLPRRRASSPPRPTLSSSLLD